MKSVACNDMAIGQGLELSAFLPPRQAGSATCNHAPFPGEFRPADSRGKTKPFSCNRILVREDYTSLNLGKMWPIVNFTLYRGFYFDQYIVL